jgi:hypothetical protein
MSFEWKGATISCREFTIADDDQIARLQTKIPEGAIVNSGTPFMEFVVGAEVVGDRFISVVTPNSTPAEIATAYAEWQALPRRFLKLWKQEVENADALDPKASALTS